MIGLYKRMCILKEYNKGFSTTSTLSGVVRTEVYKGRTRVQVSLINFCGLTEGNYALFLMDKSGNKYLFPLTESGGYINFSEPFVPEKGFVALVLFLHTSDKVIAVGQYGNGSYDIPLLKAAVASIRKDTNLIKQEEKRAENGQNSPLKYDDEAVSSINYFREKDGIKDDENGGVKDEILPEKEAENAKEDVFIKYPFTGEKVPFSGGKYYFEVKDELEHLFFVNPADDRLKKYITNSEWVRLSDGVLVGIIREETRVLYLAYALPTTSNAPIEDLEAVYFETDEGGYYLIFQDADTGEKIKLHGV